MISKTILHYRIIKKLGEGGMGVVYKAEDTKLERTVAIKFLPRHIASNEEERKRFEIEAKAAASLNHQNIATIHAIEEHDGEMFIVMEFIDGKELKQLTINNEQLSIENILNYSTQISEGLQAAHEKGVVHRDIKSANIMLTQKGDVKIMDFGLAKVRGGPQLTKEQSTLGTAAYMSPEQTRGGEVDQRTDIFSLGVLLYEMLTGQLPFKGEYEQAVIYSIVNEIPEPVTALRTGIPMELERIVGKCLKKDPAGRYQHAAELIADLGELKKESETREILSRTGVTQSQPVQQAPQQNRNKKSPVYYGFAILLLVIALALAYFFTRSQPIDSIAVLPFVNADNDPDIEYLSDGITETLITKLSQLPQLRVMARSTAFRYKGKDVTPQQVGEQLNVRAVLMGEIVQRDDVLRVNAELVDVSDGAQIWGEQYNRTMDELFAVEDAISEQISTSLRLKLNNEEKSRLVKRHTENPEAYQLYLKGRFYWNKRTAESLKTALGYFQQAVDRDPTYALAYAGIADCYALLPIYSGLSGKEAFPKAKSAALQALQIDEQLAEAYATLSNVAHFTWDMETAEKSIVRAIELNLNYASAHQWYSMLLTSGARFPEAIAEMKRALELDPLSLIINADLGDVYFRARNYDLAIQQLRKTIEMDQNFYFAQYRLGVAYIFKGEISKGMEQLQLSMRLDDDPTMLASMGYGYGISGNTEEAEKTLVLLVEVSSQRVVSPYDYAKIYAGLGDKEKAMEYLQQSLEQREWQLIKLQFDPYWDNLRDDPRFVELVKKVGLDK